MIINAVKNYPHIEFSAQPNTNSIRTNEYNGWDHPPSILLTYTSSNNLVIILTWISDMNAHSLPQKQQTLIKSILETSQIPSTYQISALYNILASLQDNQDKVITEISQQQE